MTHLTAQFKPDTQNITFKSERKERHPPEKLTQIRFRIKGKLLRLI